MKKNNFIGCLIGLAVGDAYGTTYEFYSREKMPKILPDEITGGGVFKLKPGDWTDDTSMALCLADSIIEKGLDAEDQMKKYIDWWKNGYNSVNGRCFDIGNSTWNALDYYLRNKELIEPTSASGGNGVLMRLAPIPMYTYSPYNCINTLTSCAFQSRITHPSSQSIECSMIMGAIISKIFDGERSKSKLLLFDSLLSDVEKDVYQKLYGEYGCSHNNGVEKIKNFGYADAIASDISGSGYCVTTLEAALWAFYNTDNFKDGLKKVVSLGEDTDTTGAVYGQIAGAYYGLEQISWRNKITWAEKIYNIAEKLYELNLEKNERR